MVLPDIVELLKSFGFAGLDLKKVEDKVHDFKFTSFNKHTCDQVMGEPALTSNKKVLVTPLKT